MINEIVIRKESIFQTTYTGNLQTLDDQINYIHKYDKGRTVSNVGGYQSNFITFGFDELIDFISKECQKINLKARFNCFWLNVNNGQDYNIPHIHNITGGFSVVYYHKVCCDKSPISFTHLIPCIHEGEYKYSPKNQDILIFDDRLPHMVYPCNQADHTRVSVAFNFDC
jgi:hypothetical protein